MDGNKDAFVYKDSDQSAIGSYEDDDIHPDIEITRNKFDELFGKLISESDFEGFILKLIKKTLFRGTKTFYQTCQLKVTIKVRFF